MNDVLIVAFRKEVQHSVRNLQSVFQWDVPIVVLPESLESDSLEPFHHEEGIAILAEPFFENIDAPRVVDRSRECRLATEPVLDAVVGGKFRVEDLDRHRFRRSGSGWRIRRPYHRHRASSRA